MLLVGFVSEDWWGFLNVGWVIGWSPVLMGELEWIFLENAFVRLAHSPTLNVRQSVGVVPPPAGFGDAILLDCLCYPETVTLSNICADPQRLMSPPNNVSPWFLSSCTI